MKKQEKHIMSTVIIILLCLILASVGIYFLLPEEYKESKTNKDFYSYSFVEETEIKTLYENYTSDTDSTFKNKETENNSVKNQTDANQNSVTVKEKTTKASSTTKPQKQITTKPVTTKISPSIKLSKSSVTINEGESFKLSATTVPYSTTVSWRSNNTSVATVTQSGNVKGVKEGNVTIYAEITYNGTKYSASCLVKVNNTDCTLSFNSNGGSAVSVQTVKKGSKIPLPNPTKSYSVALNANGGSLTSSQYTKYCTFDGWYENPGLNGTKYTAGSSYTVTGNKTLYAKWINPTLGNINSATRDGYTFLGWYTAESGGTKYTNMSSVSGNITLYAQWKQNPLSGWVLASNVPSNADVVNTKYTYDITSRKTSSSSTMNGWTLENTTWSWGSYGSWSSWSTTPVYNSESRKVETKSVTTSYNMVEFNYRTSDGSRVYRDTSINGAYSSYGYSKSYGEFERYLTVSAEQLNSAQKVATNEYAKMDSATSGYNKSSKTGYVLYDSNYGMKLMYFIQSENRTTYYRYQDRQKVYTYTFVKTESKESMSYPSGNDISNIQKWVQYRKK